MSCVTPLGQGALQALPGFSQTLSHLSFPFASDPSALMSHGREYECTLAVQVLLANHHSPQHMSISLETGCWVPIPVLRRTDPVSSFRFLAGLSWTPQVGDLAGL